MTSQNTEVKNEWTENGMIKLPDGREIVDPRLYEEAKNWTWSSIYAVLDGPRGWLGQEFNYRTSKNSPR
jgi:hypothetical protein